MSCSSAANADADAVEGSAMLQFKAAPSSEMTPSADMLECNVKRAMEAPLTEEGFAEVTSSCCYEDVKAFTRRLIDDLGYKVCDEGGLSGLSPFYACPASPVTFANLTQELQDAVQGANSKCHWIVDRYVECVPVSVECQVAVYFPDPAPEPVAKGFIAFRATNPAEMARTNRIIDLVVAELALATGVESKYVNVVMATGPVDGTESQSLLHVPKSQPMAINAARDQSASSDCKVFALYSFQDKSAPAPEVLSESVIVNALKGLDTSLMASRISQDLETVDAGVGVVEILETVVCEKTNGKCTHNVLSTPSSL